MKACPSNCENGFVQTTVERVVDGVVKVYPAMARCDDHFHDPKIDIPLPENMKPSRRGAKGKDWKVLTERWIQQNPAIIEVFLRLARSKAGRGKKFGIGQLTEVVRWECDDASIYGKDFRINNNFRAYIARWLIVLDPMLEKYIEFRETRF